MDIKIRVLRRGDKVLNVFPYEGSFAISIQRKTGETDIVLIKRNADGVPEIGQKFEICEGNGVVEIKVGETKVTTF